MRKNPDTDELCGYYRLMESYRDVLGEVRKRTLLNVGFLDDLSGDELYLIQTRLTEKVIGVEKTLFSNFDSEKVQAYIERFYNQLVSEKKIDLHENKKIDQKKLLDADTIKNKDVREIGAEWLCLQTLKQLKVAEFLESKGWTERQVNLALTQIISRAVYPASELKTSKWIKENSAVCEVTNYPVQLITKDKLYTSALKLFSVKDAMESFLSTKTNELFDLQDKIFLYDLTNTYFEGQKSGSQLAQFGRSKEKRSDAKLVVLALVVNVEGFIKYSSIHEGNMADCATLSDMIDNLRHSTSSTSKKAVVVIDAGIASQENLEMISAKGFEYLCVTRSKLTNYEIKTSDTVKTIHDKKGQPISLHRVTKEKDSDYYLKIKSEAKAMKERSMNLKFKKRFEDGLEIIKAAVTKKSGTKKEDKVHQRIGRLKQKYASTQKHYEINVIVNNEKKITDLTWNLKDERALSSSHGVYFLRTSLKPENEETVWTIYNTIREIEYTFRVLKTDLDLRPIYHKNDESTMAHLHLGLLAYWVVNTIRYQLKNKNVHIDWREIVRIANTQKMITTTAKNAKGNDVWIRKCSEPEEKIKELYQPLNYTFYPFTRKKICGAQT
ncbi:MAG: IS1634 family transposase [Parachlamydiaceae bacterium]|nr:IS1634 family transposase [Parachlamydiaceae bacterium]